MFRLNESVSHIYDHKTTGIVTALPTKDCQLYYVRWEGQKQAIPCSPDELVSQLPKS